MLQKVKFNSAKILYSSEEQIHVGEIIITL